MPFANRFIPFLGGPETQGQFVWMTGGETGGILDQLQDHPNLSAGIVAQEGNEQSDGAVREAITPSACG
jgi:hypothetical protein